MVAKVLECVTAAIGTAVASSNDRFAGFNDMTPARHRNVFGKAAVTVVQEIGIDLVAGLEPGNAAADRLHLPGNVDAEDLMFRRSNTRVARENRGLPRMECQSAALTDIASTFTRTSPAFGAGLSASAIRSVCGGRTSHR